MTLIKDRLKDLTDRFKKRSELPDTAIANMKRIAEEAKRAAAEAKKPKV